MARSLRYDVADSVHHVTNRGLERRDIVRDDTDRCAFVDLLHRVATRHRWRVFAWVLLDNHFHLFFRIPKPSLSAGMHDLESVYVTAFNRRHNRQGPLFQGRFHNVVVEDESHSWELSRYVHLNPCRAGLVSRPEQWQWGSYRHYLDPRHASHWLDWPTVLAERSQHEAAARIAYKRFVDDGLNELVANPFDAAGDGWIIGSEAFVKRVQAACAAEPLNRLKSPDEVISVVASQFGESPAVIRRAGRHGNFARDAAMMLCRELLEIPASQLASVFGVTPAGLSMTVRRACARLDSDTTFADAIKELRERLTL